MRFLATMMLCLSIILTAASCSDGSTDAEGQATVTILIAPDQGGGWKAIAQEFEKKYPDTVVSLKEGPASTDERENMYTRSFMAEDRVYDIVYMDIIWVPKFASKGWLVPLDEKFPAKEHDEFLPGDIAGSIFERKIYRVPMQSDAGMLYYRKDLLEKAGVKPPETFDELLEACKTLQKPPDLYGYVFQGMQYEGLVCNFLEVLWGHGGNVLDSEGKVIIHSPEALDSLAWLVRMVREERLCPEGVTTYQEEESRNIFHEGRAVFMRNWPYAWSKAQEEDSPIKGKVGIKPMVHAPGKKGAATLGGWGLGISSFSDNKEAAWRFIEFATMPKMQKLFHFKKGVIPTRRALFQDEDILKESPHYGDLYKVLIRAVPRPVHPRYAEISDILQVNLSSALVGKLPPQDAIKSIAEEIKSKLGQE